MCLLATMADKTDQTLLLENLRSLLFYLGLAIDDRLSQLRKGTPYEKVRPSDVRVFVRVLRAPQTISEIARALHVTRQAAQSSVQRLIKLQLLELQTIPGNRRDKHVAVTTRGGEASKTASQQIGQVENELAHAIGKDDIEDLRGVLNTMLDGMRTKLMQQA